ncbi:hypothetical protein IT403_01280 [Candidatus Nomurabacteria bacterium]|nr:hypothetical protein [Candidatus Nomurabacteria bacterium]
MNTIQKIGKFLNKIFSVKVNWIGDLLDPVIMKMATKKDPEAKIEKPAWYFKPTPNRMYIILKGGQFEKLIAEIPGHFVNDPENKTLYDKNKTVWDILPYKNKEDNDSKFDFLEGIHRERAKRLGVIYLGGAPGIYTILEWKMSWTEYINNEVKPRTNQLTNHYRYKYQYYTVPKVRTGGKKEDNEMLPIAVKILYTLQINNGYLFRFNADNALEVVDEKIESTIRDIMGSKTIDWLNETKHESDPEGLSVQCEGIINEHEEIKNLGVEILDITYIDFEFTGPNKEKLENTFTLSRTSKEEAEAAVVKIQAENAALFGKENKHKGFYQNLNKNKMTAVYFENKNAELMAKAIENTNASVVVLGNNTGGVGNAIVAAESAKNTSNKNPKNVQTKPKTKTK